MLEAVRFSKLRVAPTRSSRGREFELPVDICVQKVQKGHAPVACPVLRLNTAAMSALPRFATVAHP